MKQLITALLIFLTTILWPLSVSMAQNEQPEGPIYIVRSGDSLWVIAQRFGVSMDDLSQINGITNPNQLSEGLELIIPGLEGIDGILITLDVPYGENLRSLSRRYGVQQETLAQLNHITTNTEIFAGYSLVIPEELGTTENRFRAILSPGQSLLELAVLGGDNPWVIANVNDLEGRFSAIPNETLLLPGGRVDGPGALPGAIRSVELNPFPLAQGKAFVIDVSTEENLTLEGSFMSHPLNFFRNSESGYVALQGVHAMTEPGYYPLTLIGNLPDGTPYSYSQMVQVRSENYPYDRPLTVNPATIDPTVTKPEDEQWSSLALPVTPERLWNDVFQLPSPLPVDYCLETNECWTSRFGNRRSYNGSEYNSFHTGLDIAGGTGTEIYAPAPGVVVFTGPLTVRGNATMIDHGWGVYTGYMHQSENLVDVGMKVKEGQVIGIVGGTGRVEGPHLHWEVWVGGVQVDPIDWLGQSYP